MIDDLYNAMRRLLQERIGAETQALVERGSDPDEVIRVRIGKVQGLTWALETMDNEYRNLR